MSNTPWHDEIVEHFTEAGVPVTPKMVEAIDSFTEKQVLRTIAICALGDDMQSYASNHSIDDLDGLIQGMVAR
jgi:hypothetical protein